MNSPEPPKIHASFREPADDAGQIWWGTFFNKHGAEINRRFKLARIVYWGPSVKMPLDLFSYIREAAACFTVARFLATIVLSSSAVELILNRDRRLTGLEGLRKIGGWTTLNNQNLAIAAGQGLPTRVLTSDEETLVGDTPIRFVARRNKVAHGEIAEMFRNLTDYDPGAEQESFDQLSKAQRFVVDWFNTAPDVQECHIQNHKWPLPR
jgi:hypothetical protein